MTVIQRVVKPRTQRARRALEKRAPKIIENTKQCVLMQGKNTSDVVRHCMRDFYALKKQDSVHLSRKNDILPFEDILPVERMAQKHDCSLFSFVTHSKKRPNNLILGRMFDLHLLDMFELGIEDFKSLSDFSNAKISSGTKPCMVFCGTAFEDENEFIRLKNLLIDFFRGVEATDIRLQGFEHALLFTAFEGKIFLRSYRILMKKSGTRVPRIEVEEIGPSLTLTIRRNRMASDDLFKAACKQPKALKTRKVKNISKDVFGSKLGRIHMEKQDLGNLQTRKMKGLKETKEKKKEQKAEQKGEKVNGRKKSSTELQDD